MHVCARHAHGLGLILSIRCMHACRENLVMACTGCYCYADAGSKRDRANLSDQLEGGDSGRLFTLQLLLWGALTGIGYWPATWVSRVCMCVCSYEASQVRR